MENTTGKLQGYITNLGKYTEGYLVGEWVTFPVSDEELKKVFNRIRINEQYEEYFITDYENTTGIPFDFGEYTSIEYINEVIEQLEELGDDINIYKAACEVDGYIEPEDFDPDDYNFYPGMTIEDVAYDYIQGYYGSSDNFLLQYFDYAAFARDLSYDGYYETSYGTIERL